MSEANAAYSVDVVGVFNSAYEQVFRSARPIKAAISEFAKPMDHPVESGGVVTDWRVIEPVEIEMLVFAAGADYKATYQTIRSHFHGLDLFTVATKTASYPNMMIVGIPHEQSAETVDMVAMPLRLREVIMVDSQFQALSPANTTPTNESTVKRGEQPNTGSIAHGIFYGRKN